MATSGARRQRPHRQVAAYQAACRQYAILFGVLAVASAGVALQRSYAGQPAAAAYPPLADAFATDYRQLETHHPTWMPARYAHPSDIEAMIPEATRESLRALAEALRVERAQQRAHQSDTSARLDESHMLATHPHASNELLPHNRSRLLPAAAAHQAVEFDGMRTTMLGSKWMSNTDQSSSYAMDFLRKFPRQKRDGSAGAKQLQRLGGPANRSAENAAEENPIEDYLAGMFFMWGVPVFFAMLAMACWLGFCIARCWCNVCGRHATRLYTDKQINTSYLLCLLLIVIMGVCCAFGWTGNVEVSQGVDSGFSAVDKVANYGYEFMGVFSTMYAIGYDATLLGMSFNQTLALLPRDAAIVDSQRCVNTSHDQLAIQKALVATLKEATRDFTQNLTYTQAQQEAAFGVGAAANAQVSLAEPLPVTPPGGTNNFTRLQTLDQQLRSLNATLASLPTAAQMEDLITQLAVIQGFAATSGAPESLWNLTQSVRAFYTAAHAVASGTPSDLLQTLMSAVSAIEDVAGNTLHCPTDGATNCTTLLTAIAHASDTSTNALRTQLSSDYSAILGGLAALPPMATVVRQFAQLQSSLVDLNATLPTIAARIPSYRATLAGWPSSSLAYTQAGSLVQPLVAFQSGYGPIVQDILVQGLPKLIVALSDMKSGLPKALAAFSTNQAQVADVGRDVDTVALTDSIGAFNSSVAGVACFADVFDLFAFVNVTFCILPSDVTELTQTVGPLIHAQVQATPDIYASLAEAIRELAVVNATVSDPTGSQANYTALAAELDALRTTVDGVSDFVLLFDQVHDLHRTLFALTNTTGVRVQTRQLNPAYNASNVNSTEPQYLPPSTPLWANVVSVQVVADDDGVSALAPFLDTYTNVQMTNALDALTTMVTTLTGQLDASHLSAVVLTAHANSAGALAAAAAATTTLLTANTPVVAPLDSSVHSSITASLLSLDSVLVRRPLASALLTQLANVDTAIASPTSPDLAGIHDAVLGMNAGLQVLPGIAPLLRAFQTNATIDAQSALQDALASSPTQLDDLQAAFALIDTHQGSGWLAAQNTLVQSEFAAYMLPGVNGLIYALDAPRLFVTDAERDTLSTNLGRLLGLRSSLPDFGAKIADGQSAVASLDDALAYMQEKKLSYQKHKTDFQKTVDNYDGVRLLVFNLFVLLPFVLSLFLLIAAVQHYGCPAMIAGLTFFPLFALFMLMSAAQMPISVALSDHCHNTTGEIKIQTAGRIYEKEKLAFFHLQSDVAVPEITDYFIDCIGPPPEMLTKLANPAAVLAANNLEATQVQANTRAAIGGLEFAAPLQDDFQALEKLQGRAEVLFALTLNKLNCTTSSAIYHQAIDAICVDFGPAFALTTCVFLLAGICMVPGICIGVTSYKRFNPLNRDTAYTKAPTDDDDSDEFGLKHAGHHQEGWN